MKYFLRIIILITFFSLINTEAFSQSMELTYPTDGIDSISGPPLGSDLFSYPIVKNLLDTELNFKMTVSPIILTEGHTFTFCDLNTCFPEQTEEFTSPNPSTLPAGESSMYIDVALKPNGIEGVSEINCRFFNVDNPTDFVDYSIIFNVTVTAVNEPIVKSYIVSTTWPNPAIDIVNIRHSSLLNNSSIHITNANGVQIGNIKINNAENNTSINTSAYYSGTYFYNIIDNGKIWQSGKFIILK
ncbi:T9SS type A sorting domain-containing protein [Bacteroidota bacterium]